jgi:serine protease Do
VPGQETPLTTLEERAFQQAAAIADPSIVRIETIGGEEIVDRMVTATGPTTGVVVDPEGWIITSSFNFVANPASTFVTTPDGQRHPARILGRDESRHLTLLKINASGLKPLVAARREEFRVGQWAIALGRTFDLSFPNLSVGIVSALDRISGRAIQTDANTSPVNYGGPLVDIEGRGLGILVPMSTQGEQVTAGVEYYDSGIGFAVPLADVMAVLDRLKAGETLKPGKLGVSFEEKGVLGGEVKVIRVRPRSPAADAGLKSGDVIIGADGRAIDRAAMLRQVLGPRYGGDRVELQIRRGEQTLDLPITLADEIAPFERGFLGVLPERPSGESAPAGILIRDIVPNSPAAGAGLKPGDRITAVRGQVDAADSDIRKVLQLHVPGERVAVDVTSEGESRSVEVELAPFPDTVAAIVPPQAIPTPGDQEGEKPKVGRFVEQVTGDERKYWAYVPEHYNPSFSYGLVVWLHPEGEGREAVTLERWRSLCEERGLILVGPPASREGWMPGDLPFILATIGQIRERYNIDPARIAVIGEAQGGQVALLLAFRQRDIFSGVASIGAMAPSQIPETDPEHPLSLHISAFESDPQLRRIERGVESVREQKYPVIFRRWSGANSDGPSAEAVGELARWVDSLDAL